MAEEFVSDPNALVGAHVGLGDDVAAPDQLMPPAQHNDATNVEHAFGGGDNQLVENILALAGGDVTAGLDPEKAIVNGAATSNFPVSEEPPMEMTDPLSTVIAGDSAGIDQALAPETDSVPQEAVEPVSDAVAETPVEAQPDTTQSTVNEEQSQVDPTPQAEASMEVKEAEGNQDGAEGTSMEITANQEPVDAPDSTQATEDGTTEAAPPEAGDKTEESAPAAKSTDSGPTSSQKDTERPEVISVKAPAPPPSKPAQGAPKASKGMQTCIVCKKVCKCKYNIVRNGDIKHLCGEECFKAFRGSPARYLSLQSQQSCGYCLSSLENPSMKLVVDKADIFFCKSSCMDGFRATNTCLRCGKLYKVGHKGTYCSAECFNSEPVVAQKPQTGKCSVCQKTAPMSHQANLNKSSFSFCGEFCMSAFLKANTKAIITRVGCDQCGKACQRPDQFTQVYEGRKKCFCSSACRNVYKGLNSRTVVCSWCKSKKDSCDMLAQEDDGKLLFCTLNCLSLYRVNKQATSTMSVKCDNCSNISPAQYHLTMSDASVRNFCSYKCVMDFQAQFSTPKGKTPNAKGTPVSTGKAVKGTASGAQTKAGSINITPQGKGATPARSTRSKVARKDPDDVPQISQVMSLASNSAEKRGRQSTGTGMSSQTQSSPVVIVKPQEPTLVRNKTTLCKPLTLTKATSCRPHTQSKECQTDDDLEKKQPTLVPVPVPIYVPVPMPMYSIPVPHPLPIPVPIPVPCFIPTTRKSADGIIKQIQKLRDTLPADPFEAEMLMMAEAVAGQGKDSDSESDNEETAAPADAVEDGAAQAEEDVLSMALRMANEMQPASDFENSINPTTIDPNDVPVEAPSIVHEEPEEIRRPTRNKRSRESTSRGRAKKIKSEEQPLTVEQPYIPPPVPAEPEVPPDHNMVLKFTYGVNAWKHWVTIKNIELEKQGVSNKKKMIKLDLLACSPDELNLALSMFVKEVRKPNGEEYAPDSIFYLCLGIQEYIFENSRVDNIFTDIFYENFNRCLNEVLQNYEVRLNAQGLIVCRIEEEHLWESKQLGAHSPYVLLNTLVYFNTKYFLLRTPEEHLRLSFSHIMKHWKKTGKVGGRSVYLRFYAPQMNTDPSQRGRRREDMPVFEQGENLDNPLRCPVKLYEFYLSKCPESIKNRNDVFYLTPERSCVPDSPVWYSTQNLSYESMARMLNRLRVVKEIQEAHLQVQTPGFIM